MDPKSSTYFIRLIKKNDSELQYMVNHPKGIKKEARLVAQYILDERKQAIDFKEYTYDELLESLSWINKEKYPVRLTALKSEINDRKDSLASNRLINEESANQSFSKNTIPEFRIRPGVKISTSADTVDDYISINEAELSHFLNHPKPLKEVIIEDFDVKISFMFDDQKNEFGYKFWYFDKFSNKEYQSRLHGISTTFAVELIAGFLESGKKELQILEWKEVNKSFLNTLFSAINTVIAIFFGVLVLLSFLKSDFLITVYSDFVIDFIQDNPSTILTLAFLSLIMGVVKDRHQIQNLSKLSTNEVVDTLSSILMIPVFVFIIYFMWISDGFIFK